MKQAKAITILTIVIVVFAAIAASIGIFSSEGPGRYEYTSIRNIVVTIYGKGLYQHMSAEVAPQGIAQDYITLFVAIPLLIISLLLARKGSVRGRYLLAGSLVYFLVTYLFYSVMAMYNFMYLAYIILLGASFYAFILTLFTFNRSKLSNYFKATTPFKLIGGFLVFCAVSIAFLWLSIIIPPLADGSIIPMQAEHYTTLIVQALDLGILLPAAFISGILLWRKATSGFLIAPVYLVFLSLLMTALSAKVIAMALLDYPVVPVIFIIPSFNILTVICTIVLLKNCDEEIVRSD